MRPGFQRKENEMQQSTTTIVKQNPQKVNLTCQHCKHQGSDVEGDYYYLGGQGYVWRNYCLDTVACWKRWEAKQ